ncbi:MAG TPA: hypothetical protein VFQ39_05955 [Longimicrobium sp.]|nr:hypothetical protein [Longimicrobium sp.]
MAMEGTEGHGARLRAFEEAIRAQGFDTAFVPASDEVPYDVLAVALGGDEAGDAVHQLELSFIPGMEEQLEGAALLQCFVHLPAEVPAAAEDGLRRLIALLNGRLPLVGFGWLEAEEMLCFRHAMMLPPDDRTATPLVVQAVWMIGYLLSVFADTVVEVATGARAVDDALRDNPFRSVFE